MNRRLIVLLTTVLTIVALVAGHGTVGAATKPECADKEEQEFLRLINDFRKENNLPSLTLSLSLSKAANVHSEDMAKNNFLGHTGSNGSRMLQRMTDAGYSGWSISIGENVFGGDKTAAEAFKSWKESPPHRANMLSKDYKAIGIARSHNANSQYGWYWTTTFGDAVDAKPGCLEEPATSTSSNPTGQGGQATAEPTKPADEGAQSLPANSGQPTGGNPDNAETNPDNGRRDTDSDGLPDEIEAEEGTDPNNYDTDSDGVSDGDEVYVYYTDPTEVDTWDGVDDDLTDSDGDGLVDSEETTYYDTDPYNADTDGDGVDDSNEVYAGTDPLDPESY